MTTIYHTMDRASFSQRLGRVFAACLLVGSLAMTGCDSIDSNAPDEGTPPAAAQERSIGMIYWITPDGGPEVLNQEYTGAPSPGWPVSQLIGTWVLVVADIQALTESDNRPLITFHEDGLFTGYSECYNFSGRYRASSNWALTISDFRATNKFCYQENDSVREALFAGLQAATEFRFEHGTLWIMSRGGKRGAIFIFERLEDDRERDAIGMPPATAQ